MILHLTLSYRGRPHPFAPVLVILWLLRYEI